MWNFVLQVSGIELGLLREKKGRMLSELNLQRFQRVESVGENIMSLRIIAYCQSLQVCQVDSLGILFCVVVLINQSCTPNSLGSSHV